MKKRYLLGFTLAALSLSSCGYNDFFTIEYASITVSDSRSTYVAGDIYDQVNELTVIGTYRSGKQEEVTKDKYEYVITYNKDGQSLSFDGKTAFAAGGTDYKVVVTVGKLKESLSINVLDHHIYVSSLSLSGANECNVWESVDLALTVSPTNYTVPITYTLNDPTLADYTKSSTGVTIAAKKAGELVVTASANGESGVISTSHTITLKATAIASKASQTYSTLYRGKSLGTNVCPSSGSPKILVIPVWLTDSSSYIDNLKKETVREDISNSFFGSTTDTGWQSVSSYYKYESDDELNITGTVSNWYNSGKSALEVGDPEFNTGNLVKTASDWYFSSTGESRTDYDSDGDGFIDATVLIYAAPDQSQTGFDGVDAAGNSIYGNLWAYCFWAKGKASTSAPTSNVYLWASYDFMYSSITATVKTGHAYANGDTTNCRIDAHTYIHEFGHVLGLDDYYDYSKQYNPAGGFSMQDANVGGHDPYSLYALGWATAYHPTGTSKVVLQDFQSSHQVILLANNFNEYNSPFDEYLLLELYSPTGLNEFDSLHTYSGNYPIGPSAVGIRLWHIDARLAQKSSLGWNGFYNDATLDNAQHAMSNTYYKAGDSSSIDYISPLGTRYANYNILQLIRNSSLATYLENTDVVNADLFLAGDSFSINNYYKQFVRGDRLQFNNESRIGWSFTVESITTKNGVSNATISITKA